MHILMGVHGLPPHSVGGAEKAALELARLLAFPPEPDLLDAHPPLEGHHVTLFAPLHDPALEVGSEQLRLEAAPNGMSGVPGSLRIHLRKLPPPQDFEQTFRHAPAEQWFDALVEEQRPDVVHLHHLTHLSMGLVKRARHHNLPVVLTLHDYWLLCARGQRLDLELKLCGGPTPLGCATCLSDQLTLDRLTPAIPLGNQARAFLRTVPIPPRVQALLGGIVQRFTPAPAVHPVLDLRLSAAQEVLALATRVVCPSQHLLEYFAEWADRNPCGPSVTDGATAPLRLRMRMLRQSVGVRNPAPPQTPRTGPLRVGFLGSMIPTKGPQILLAALEGMQRKHHDTNGVSRVRVTLAGPVPPFHRAPTFGAELRVQAQKVGATLLPALAPEQVSTFLRSQDVLVVPSLWPENAPLVIGEALRQGLPVVASQVGGIPEWVQHDRNGWLFPPGDVPALQHLLKRLIENPGELERLRAGALASPLPSPSTYREEALVIYRESISPVPKSGITGSPVPLKAL